MADPNVLHASIMATLRALPDVGERVYDGIVPVKVPEVGGYIRAYIVVWSGIGSDLPAERDLSGLTDVGVLDWAPQTQVVAADANTCRLVAQQVREALTNKAMGAGWLQPNPDAFRVNTPIPDTGATPTRFFLPLPWRLLTT